MEDLFSISFNWGHLLTSTFFLLSLYLALRFINRMLIRTSFLGSWHEPARRWFQYVVLIFEPLALVFLMGIFVLINPIFHGLLLVLIILSAFSQMRNYISGRIVQLDHQIERGSHLRTGNRQGVVLNMRPLGIRVQTKEGLYHLSYSKLLRDGYTLISGDEIGGFYQLKISPKEPDAKTRHLQHLQSLLVTAPYLDWSHKPEVNALDDQAQHLEARVLVREENHLHHLVALIREWGYHCELTEM